jgi:hypothetical protein
MGDVDDELPPGLDDASQLLNESTVVRYMLQKSTITTGRRSQRCAVALLAVSGGS